MANLNGRTTRLYRQLTERNQMFVNKLASCRSVRSIALLLTGISATFANAEIIKQSETDFFESALLSDSLETLATSVPVSTAHDEEYLPVSTGEAVPPSAVVTQPIHVSNQSFSAPVTAVATGDNVSGVSGFESVCGIILLMFGLSITLVVGPKRRRDSNDQNVALVRNERVTEILQIGPRTMQTWDAQTVKVSIRATITRHLPRDSKRSASDAIQWYVEMAINARTLEDLLKTRNQIGKDAAEHVSAEAVHSGFRVTQLNLILVVLNEAKL